MKVKLLFFALLLSFFACQNKVTPEQVEALATAVYNEDIKKLDPAKAMEYVKACEDYATAHPEDKRSPEWLLKAAETARNINKHDQAIAIYDKVMTSFPDYEKAPQALFLKAFTIDDNMNRKDEAKVLYEEFLSKYPTDDFAESAKFMLKNLNKTDAQIIEEFEKSRLEGQAKEVEKE